MTLIALIWMPVVRGQQGLYYYLESVQGYLAPPIFAVFFFGVFFKRMNAAGCLSALLVGFALGVFRLVVDTPLALRLNGFAGYAEGSFLWAVNRMYFQYYSVVIFLVSSLVMVAVSCLGPAPDYRKIEGLTYGTITAEHRAESRRSYDWRDIAGSAVVLTVILIAYLYFNG